MQNQDSRQSAFKKLSLAPKALLIAAGAGLMLTANAGPGRAFNINDGEMNDAAMNDAAMIVASYSSSVVSSSTVSYSSSTVSYSSSTVVSSSSYSSSSSSTEDITVNGTAFNQPGDALDLTTTA